jgi:hypothetical protein
LRRKSAETDGDLHIELQDADRDQPGDVVAEIPANRRGVKFARRFSVGSGHTFPCTFDQVEDSRSMKRSLSPSLPKCFGIHAIHPKIDQTIEKDSHKQVT